MRTLSAPPTSFSSRDELAQLRFVAHYTIGLEPYKIEGPNTIGRGSKQRYPPRRGYCLLAPRQSGPNVTFDPGTNLLVILCDDCDRDRPEIESRFDFLSRLCG